VELVVDKGSGRVNGSVKSEGADAEAVAGVLKEVLA
jgi:hypothetical protein